MPEIKHNFTGGKMNRDVDERLVPKGQYKSALNIQVSTSEGSDVGTVQNILGNFRPENNSQQQIIGSTAICVGAVADEKNDTFYWFINESDSSGTMRDMILQFSEGVVTPVFVDIIGTTDADGNTIDPVLKFDRDNLITGINIIDDMLFWVDGHYDGNGNMVGSEPKKINIPRSISGTANTALAHTNFVNPGIAGSIVGL